ncbi:MAG: SpoIID/LytB domain-containing protein [Bacteroidia bacterium]|nr:SpoIID/LytB domain-containing protein [Bacteroidia bacterium]
MEITLFRNFFCAFLLLSFSCFAGDSIRIGLFDGQDYSQMVLSVSGIGYSLNGLPMEKGDVIKIDVVGDSLKGISLKGIRVSGRKLELYGPLLQSFRLKMGNSEARLYKGSLEIRVLRGRIRVVNITGIEQYVSGVIDAEVGPKFAMEFYKVQAIIARTFAYENMEKHLDEGFNLCDQVHCQVFKGLEIRNERISLATAKTESMVIRDAHGALAFVPYHSNCGGYTESSENVWGGEKIHLKPVQDTFCLKQSKAVWEKKVSREKWDKWLTRHHMDGLVGEDFQLTQIARKKEIDLAGQIIATRKVRSDFGLSSAYFNIKTQGKEVIFTGKGYGHGVGICQQGANRMAELGYSYRDIIAHYYKGVRIGKIR